MDEIPATAVPIRVSYISDAELVQKAEDFLSRYNSTGQLPVPIEQILELSDLNFNILPVPGLENAVEVPAYLCFPADRPTIVTDQKRFENAHSHRFTCAHELCHYLLHRNLLEKVRNREDYRNFTNSLSAKEEKMIEAQAYRMAGYILMPRRRFRDLVDATIQDAGGLGNVTADDLSRIGDMVVSTFEVSQLSAGRQLQREYPELCESALSAL